MRQKFKFACRKGRNIEVCFDFAPKTWLSTGTKDKNKALEFALEKVKREEKKQETLLADYLQELTTDKFHRLKVRDENFGRKSKETYYNDLTYLSKTYLLKLFGRFILQRLTVDIVENALINLQESNLTKNRIIYSLRAVYNLAIQEGLLEFSPIDKLNTFSYEPKEREIFTKEELEVLFYKDNFTSSLWFLYFLILKDTGWRPGEVASLKFKDINQTGGLSTTSSVVYNGKKAELQDKIKTSAKGQDYKIGLLSSFTLKVLQEIKKDKNEEEFIFLFNGKLLLTQTANRELEKAFNRAGLELKGRTQYSFRHTFNTRYYYILDEKTRLELMGHTHERKEYLHLRVNDRLNHLMENKIINQ